MSYTEWEEFYKDKKVSNKKNSTTPKSTSKPTSKKSTPTTNKNKSKTNSKKVLKEKNGKTNTSKRKSKNATHKKKLNKKHKVVNKIQQSIMWPLIISVVLGVGVSWISQNSQAITTEDDYYVEDKYEDEEIEDTQFEETQEIEISNENIVDIEQKLLNYKDFCYYDKYGSKTYLYCPEEYIYMMAEHTINKLNTLYANAGMTKLSNGKCIPDIISPELMVAFAMTEGAYRVEHEDGLPLGADRKCAASDRAEGMLQQKPGFVSDANIFSKRMGGTGYSNEDRYNPLKAMEISVTNLTSMYRTYLMKDKSVYRSLNAQGENDPKLQMALIIAYYQGQGRMQKWAHSGILNNIYANPKSTNSYGADYYRKMLVNIANVDCDKTM